MSPLGPVSTATPLADPRGDIAKAAQGFEAIFVRQLLAAARKASFGEDSLMGGQGMDTFRQMQDERFADIAAERGSFGLAKVIAAQLARQVGPAQE